MCPLANDVSHLAELFVVIENKVLTKRDAMTDGMRDTQRLLGEPIPNLILDNYEELSQV
jgi:hypothetical protein